MQHIDEHGCLTQRSQLDRLRDLADGSTRERIRTLEPNERLSTTVFVIDATGAASTWDLDHLSLARFASEAPTQLLLEPVAALDNLVPTQAIMRILRDTGAAAVAAITPVSVSAAALQLADIDHEQSLTALIDRQPEREPQLSPWDFGKVAWTVRLRQVLRAARAGAVDDPSAPGSAKPAATAASPARPAEPAPGRRNHRREMREQLHHQSAPAPSWLQ
ncbi:MAG: hypothetical protein E6I84_09480 [Chloroflexi bacterium]|nr:MAG: hypothetical protein E6I84_09480 [Chloroflexota bacterium]